VDRAVDRRRRRQQHALFILAHEAAHYRLFRRRALNDAIGRAIGMAGAISMCTYRVIHRLHHNNLYTEEDPDTAIHGGYPRGTAYLWKKLAQDAVGWNAWKTFAYFFGAPALNDQTQRAARPLDDTSPQLRRSARIDRWFVVAFQLLAPLACFALGGWLGLAQYAAFWLVPMLTVLQPILRLRAICEHGATTDFSSPLTAARSNRTGGGAVNVLGRALCSRITSTTTSSTTSIRRCRTTTCRGCTGCSPRRARSTAPRCAISARPSA
jgi:fatty acid desaturase